ncbi:hypothetical protein CDEST_07868 [Colletotrichum destructivum]|uniref:Uncharacterized protein n=1 Tax=Colletotrichum destructivum TaxID=34406 RepID=A0AAX4IJ33_9PEZI|nr:hypothetical protein CDEST_07868 [Colletotrichum destructivum]
MSSNTSCPDASTLPTFDDLSGLPRNVSVGFVPVGRNGSHEAMSSCCSPEAVNIASDCYYWCELPTDGLNGFASCLVRRGMADGIVGVHESSAASSTTSRNLTGLILWALFVTSALRL